MKTLYFFLIAFVFTIISATAFAQTKKETFAVSGECKMCKKKIETAAKAAGATYAVWDVDSKKLTVKYDEANVNTAAIQQRIADAGYDTPLAKASDSAYNNLDDCCQYQRTQQTDHGAAAPKGATAKESCCTKDAACCKEGSTCCAKH